MKMQELEDWLLAKKCLGIALYWWVMVTVAAIGLAVGIPLYNDIWGSK